MKDEEVVEAKTIFNFISDEQFRDSLTSDYVELVKSLQSGAWKAVHVLAGSVIEALLVDYLMTVDYKKKTGKDPLELDLHKAVEACKAEKVISEKAADLSTVVRRFRNLIHPGRVRRLQEKINGSSASVAKALVDIIIDEVATARKERYGLNAEQILAKIESDPSSLPILTHLLKETTEYERERLVMQILPQKHLMQKDDEFYPHGALENCFRLVFDSLPDEKKTLVTRRFVSILKQQSQDEVLNYETAFFCATDLQYLDPNEIELVREHLLSQMKVLTSRKIEAFKGLAPFLNKFQIRQYFGYMLRAALLVRHEDVRVEARSEIIIEYQRLSDDAKKIAMDHIQVLRDTYNEKDQVGFRDKVNGIISEMVEEEIPF